MSKNTDLDRRHFLSGAVGMGCGCMAVATLETAWTPSEVAAQERKGRGNSNPLITPIAYCGLFCGACGGLHDTVKNGKKEGACLGCKSNVLGGHCAKCKVRDCAMSRQIANCGLCAEYPCDKIKEYHNDEKEGTYMAIARKNSEDFMYLGDLSEEEWSEKQAKRWTCPKCNTPFRFTDKECSKCGGKIPTVEVEAAAYAKRNKPGSVEFAGKNWQNNLAYKTEVKKMAGKETLTLLGNERTMVFLPDAGFRDGTIECDISVKSSGGLAFRTSEDGLEAEIVQIRFLSTKKERNKKLLAYCHHKHWHTGWRELRKEQPGKYDVDPKLARDKWFRLKLVVSGQKLDVFLDKDETPVLTVEKLLGKRESGGIGLYGEEARFAEWNVS